MGDSEMSVVVSGPCFRCDNEITPDLPGILIRRVTSLRSSDEMLAAGVGRAGVALCQVCIGDAETRLMSYWNERPRPGTRPGTQHEWRQSRVGGAWYCARCGAEGMRPDPGSCDPPTGGDR